MRFNAHPITNGIQICLVNEYMRVTICGYGGSLGGLGGTRGPEADTLLPRGAPYEVILAAFRHNIYICLYK